MDFQRRDAYHAGLLLILIYSQWFYEGTDKT